MHPHPGAPQNAFWVGGRQNLFSSCVAEFVKMQKLTGNKKAL
jgi:hypothetical protein